jgi:hypothetical protein
MRLLAVFFCAFVVGCASTTVALNPSPQPPVCDPKAAALVLWAPQWRADQKDVAQRELAAQTGLQNFLADSSCFARAELQRISDLSPSSVSARTASAASQFSHVVVIAVRELGPVVKLLSSAALVDGGTEVVLHISAYSPPEFTKPREFSVHWQHGGPGVIKGVASLPSDMQAALASGLQPVSGAQ